MLLMGFKSGGAQPCCVAPEYLTLKMPLGLAGAGCLQSLASAGLSLQLLGYLKQRFFPKPGILRRQRPPGVRT